MTLMTRFPARLKRAAAAGALTASGLVMNAEAADAGMSRYQWKNRPLIVFAPSGSDERFGRQQAAVQTNRAGLMARDMVVIAVVGEHVSSQLGPEPGARAAALRARYGIGRDEFRTLLIGKDGGVKISSARPVGADQLFRTIDAMPMRRDELRRRGR